MSLEFVKLASELNAEKYSIQKCDSKSCLLKIKKFLWYYILTFLGQLFSEIFS